MSRSRHSRQVRLAEVGEEGQARLEGETAVVESVGLVGVVEGRYLAGAGVRTIATGDEAVADAARAVDPTVAIVEAKVPLVALGDPPSFGVRDPAALEVVMGAWRALAHLRRATLGTKRTDPR
jgi:hypothetical protein